MENMLQKAEVVGKVIDGSQVAVKTAREDCRIYGCKTCKKNYCVQHCKTHMSTCYLCQAYQCEGCIQRCSYCRRTVCISTCSDGEDCSECATIGAEEEQYVIDEDRYVNGW